MILQRTETKIAARSLIMENAKKIQTTCSWSVVSHVEEVCFIFRFTSFFLTEFGGKFVLDLVGLHFADPADEANANDLIDDIYTLAERCEGPSSPGTILPISCTLPSSLWHILSHTRGCRQHVKLIHDSNNTIFCADSHQ